MPTIVRTEKHITTNTKGAPLWQASQFTNLWKDRDKEKNKDMGQSQGHILGAKPLSRKSTPPDQDRDSVQNPDKTPSARAKVLPWVQGVESDNSPPEGMFGPYDSQPATRVNTVHEATAPPAQPRAIHPFAYGASGALPFSALAGEEGAEYLRDQAGQIRPDSEVLSRGAGMRYLNQPFPGMGAAERTSPTGSKESAGVGTFGRDVAPPPLPKSPARQGGSPLKAPSQARTAAGDSPAGKAKSNVSRKPVPTTATPPPQHGQAHLHHPHHDFPFSHAEAAQKQAEAMESARAQALAQLQSSPGRDQPPAAAAVAAGAGQKGPRQTLETSTSGPSFGHLLHQDGRLMPRMGLPHGPAGGVPMARESFGGTFRIPFGVPMGAMLPRPLMMMRTNTGLNMGIGIPGPGLTDVAESPESKGRRADRSAYVETVEDEQEPKEPTVQSAHTRLAKSAGPPSSKSRVQSAAIAESGIHPVRHSVPQGAATARHSTPPPEFAPPPQTTPSLSPGERRSPRAPTVGVIAAGSKTAAMHDQLSPIGQAVHQSPRSKASTKAASVLSDTNTHGTAMPHHHHAHSPSVAPTTVSNVKRIVADSKFHDETLCQLLDAARLNLVGPEAKKALNRAARARVIELKDLRQSSDGGDLPPMPPLVDSSPSKSKHSPSKSKDHRSRAASASKRSEKVEKPAEPTTPPQWAQEIITRLAAFDARFTELEKSQAREFAPADEELLSQDIPDAPMMDDAHVLLHELQGLGLGSAFPGASPFGGNPFNIALGFPPPRTGMPQSPHQTSPSHGGKIQTLSPTEVGRGGMPQGDELIWGSEVELPAPEDTIPPPRPAPTVAPTINIQAPTESDVAKTATRVPSGGALSRSDPRTPRQVDVSIIEEQIITAEPALPDPRERSLPATPAESIQSHRPSPVHPSSQFAPTDPRTPGRTVGGTVHDLYSSPKSHAKTANTHLPTSAPSPNTAAAVTALTHQPAPTTPKQRSQVMNQLGQIGVDPMPWDIVTQRLYSWALVWDDNSFVRALETISLGKQVEEMPLTIFALMSFKRLLRRNMSSIPKKQCDKLLVPPTLSDAINKAVHSKNFSNARQILEELWYPFGFSDPPRVIIALAKHRNEGDHWTAHRFDLSNGHLTSYTVTSDEETLADGRPFMWWHAIREAWPQYNIPHPDHLRQRVEYVRTMPEERNDNSLRALNYARNLLLGFRPELARDMQQLRETVWSEVKRLLQKKRQGKLVVALDSPNHVDEF